MNYDLLTIAVKYPEAHECVHIKNS